MENRNWLITGISSGLGKALAEHVIEKGDFVIGTFRRQSQVDEFNSKYEGKAVAYLLDITNQSRIDQLVPTIIETHQRVDVLVNNAGIGFIGAIEEVSMDECRGVFEANFFGVLKLTQVCLSSMRAKKKGHIIQISSQSGIKAAAGFGIYNASKFALEGFSEALAQEIAPFGIKLSIVEPGPFRTEFAGSSLREAATLIADYQETAGAFRQRLKGINGIQEGDPIKAANAIYELSLQREPSLRLPLGKLAVTTIEMKLDSVRNDLEKNRSIAEGAVY